MLQCSEQALGLLYGLHPCQLSLHHSQGPHLCVSLLKECPPAQYQFFSQCVPLGAAASLGSISKLITRLESHSRPAGWKTLVFTNPPGVCDAADVSELDHRHPLCGQGDPPDLGFHILPCGPDNSLYVYDLEVSKFMFFYLLFYFIKSLCGTLLDTDSVLAFFPSLSHFPNCLLVLPGEHSLKNTQALYWYSVICQSHLNNNTHNNKKATFIWILCFSGELH